MNVSSPNTEGTRNACVEGRIRQTLATQHYPSLRALGVTARNGTVTLSGEVTSFHERQLALAVCRQTEGVQHVVDRLAVVDNPGKSCGCH